MTFYNNTNCLFMCDIMFLFWCCFFTSYLSLNVVTSNGDSKEGRKDKQLDRVCHQQEEDKEGVEEVFKLMW